MAGLCAQLSLLGRRDYGLLWWGGMVSRVGDAFTLVAVSWLLAERDAGGQLGVVLVAYEVAAIVGGLVLSGLMDAFSRRWLMIGDSVARALAVGSIPLVGLFHAPGLETLVPAMAVLGFFSPTADVGMRALTVDLLAPDELAAGNSLEQLQWTLSWLAGPALAGLLIDATGALTALWVDAASFALFAVCLALMSRRADVLHRAGGGGFRRDIAEGLAYVGRQPHMRVVVQLVAGARVSEGMWMLALPFLVHDAGGGAGAFGALVAAMGVGSVVGSLLSGSLRMRWSLTIGLSTMFLAEAALLATIALTPPLPVIGVILAVMGVVFAPANVWLLTLRQRVAPPELLGRVLSVTMMLNRAGQPAGTALGGATIGVLGPAGLFAAGAGLLAADSGLSLAWRSWRRLPLTADGRWTGPPPAQPELPGHARPAPEPATAS